MTEAQPRRRGELANLIIATLRGADDWCTVRAVHERISQDTSIAYTTVLTVMQRLQQQGVLDHQRNGRSGEYRMAVNADRGSARTMVDQAVARFGTVAVAQFVAASREDPELLAELRRQMGMSND